LRLISTKSLKIQESTLTGESVPTEKDAAAELPDETPLGDRKTMAYSSGIVTYGRGTGVVVATGMDTEVGKIAGMLNTQEKNDTPLQVQLAKTAKLLSFVVLGVALIIFIAGIINRDPSEALMDSIVDSFMVAVAIAVAPSKLLFNKLLPIELNVFINVPLITKLDILCAILSFLSSRACSTFLPSDSINTLFE